MNLTTLCPLALAIAGCASSSAASLGDRHFEAGKYSAAARAYEAALSRKERQSRPDRALLRQGLAYLLAGDRGSQVGSGEPAAIDRSIRALNRLLTRYPDSPYAPQAVATLPILRELKRLRTSSETLRQQLDLRSTELRSCHEQAAALKGAMESQESRLSATSDQNDEHTEEIEKLQNRIANQRRRIDELKRALSALKRIDMQRAPLMQGQAHALQVKGLVKSYQGRRVVDDLDLHVQQGAVLGLLGPNGAGKTTTLRMLYGFIEPEAGTIHYHGRDFGRHREEIKRYLGVCTQDDTLDYDLTVRQNLHVYAGYFRPQVEDLPQRCDDLLARFGLNEYADASPHALSGGYKRRLLIARSVVHAPRVLFLDEPTTGLDPKARADVWELIDGMRAEGLGIVLTTHYMDEAEKLSDDIVVLSRGVDVAHGTTQAVLGHLVGEHVLVVPSDEPNQLEIQRWLGEMLPHAPSRVLRELRAPLSTEQLARFSERFAHSRFSVREPNLDDLFLKLSLETELGAK